MALPLLLAALLTSAPSALAASPDPGALVLTVPSADDPCCAQNVVALLQALPFVKSAGADVTSHTACAVLSGPTDISALTTTLTEGGYPPASVMPSAACPAGTQPRVDPWTDVGTLDARVISHGETVDLAAHRAPQGFTIYDFGAPWCGPCHANAADIKRYMATHPDVSVRAVVLEGKDAKVSFALPPANGA